MKRSIDKYAQIKTKMATDKSAQEKLKKTSDQNDRFLNLWNPFLNNTQSCKICMQLYNNLEPNARDKNLLVSFQQEFTIMRNNNKRKVGNDSTIIKCLFDSLEVPANISLNDLISHFDEFIRNPLCGFNEKRCYDFYKTFNSIEEVTNVEYLTMLYKNFLQNRNAYFCPFVLLAIYLYNVIKQQDINCNGVSKLSFKWILQILNYHKIRQSMAIF